MDTQPIGNVLAQSYKSASTTTATAGPAAVTAATAAAGTAPEQSAVQIPSPAELAQAVASINHTMQKLAPGLEFSVDQESNRTIVKVVDKQTNELIRQMPSAETLEIAKAMDRVQGLLISLHA